MLDFFKDAPAYQWMTESAREEGLAKGREEGIEIARQKQRQALLEVVKQRFPILEALATQQVGLVTDVNALSILLVNIASAHELEVVRKLLESAVQ